MQEAVAQWFFTGLGMAAWGIPFIVVVGLLGKTYINSYSSEKAKNLATKEDFEEIKKRLSESSEVTERIRSSIAGKAWLRQQHWSNQDRHYTAVLTHLAEMHDAIHTAHNLMIIQKEGNVSASKMQAINDELEENIKMMRVALGALRASYASACIYFSDDAKAAVSTLIAYKAKHRLAGDKVRDADAVREQVLDAMLKVQASAVQELKKLEMLG